jgi:hypothetical protein
MAISAFIVKVPGAESLVGALRERFDATSKIGVPAHLTARRSRVPLERLPEGRMRPGPDLQSIHPMRAIPVHFEPVSAQDAEDLAALRVIAMRPSLGGWTSKWRFDRLTTGPWLRVRMRANSRHRPGGVFRSAHTRGES